MGVWYKVAWLDPLFAAFNTLNPDREKSQDGTIGDAAHQGETSGHNPDDTPGVRAERQDADSKPEVRAGDVDARGVDMEAAVQRVLHGPAAERDRLIYIIFNHRIWRKANGWREERYTGSDPHETHAHFSGDPASDEDGRPWTSIMGDGMANAAETNASRNSYATTQLLAKYTVIAGDEDGGAPTEVTNLLAAAVKGLQKDVAAILARPPVESAPVDQAAINSAVSLALADPSIVAGIATAVADENYRRQAQ